MLREPGVEGLLVLGAGLELIVLPPQLYESQIAHSRHVVVAAMGVVRRSMSGTKLAKPLIVTRSKKPANVPQQRPICKHVVTVHRCLTTEDTTKLREKQPTDVISNIE